MAKTEDKLNKPEENADKVNIESEELCEEDLESITGGAVGVAQYSRMVKERFEREKKELQSAGN